MKKIIKHFEYDIIEVTDSFVRGFLDIETTDIIHRSIHKEIENLELEIGLIGSENDLDKDELDDDMRQSEIHWLQKSKKAKAYAHQLVNEINDQYFDLELEKQQPPDIQYTCLLYTSDAADE